MVALALFGAGNFIGFHSTAVAVLVFVIVLIPILGFTISQLVLTMKGRRVVSSSDEVRALMQANAVAFTQFFAALFRKLRADDVYPRLTLPGADSDSASNGQRRDIETGRGVGTRTFWFCLEPAERAELVRAAESRKYGIGVTLWRQNEHADSVVIVRSGRILILAGEKLIAVRGKGDIIGERAALHEGQRSATVITASTVRAYVIATSAFSDVAARHPHILGILENQIYDRLTERPFAQVGGGEGNMPASTQIGLAPPGLSLKGENCSICLVDVVGFTAVSRTDLDRRSVRAAMYEMLTDAFRGAGIPWLDCHREDRGDGALVIVPPGTPTTAVIHAALEHLAPRLHRHNREAGRGTQIALRVAVSVGPVVADPNGVSGHAINLAARLIEARTLKDQFSASATDLGLVVSAFVYETVISQNVPLDELSHWRRIKFRAMGAKMTAWMYLSRQKND